MLYALAGTPELAWAAAKHGGVVYILELLLPPQGRVNPTISFSFILSLLCEPREMIHIFYDFGPHLYSSFLI